MGVIVVPVVPVSVCFKEQNVYNENMVEGEYDVLVNT